MGLIEYFKRASDILYGRRKNKDKVRPVITLYPEIDVYVRGEKIGTVPVPTLERANAGQLINFCKKFGWKADTDGTLDPQEIKNPKKDTTFFYHIKEVDKEIIKQEMFHKVATFRDIEKNTDKYFEVSRYVEKHYPIYQMPPCFVMLQSVLLHKDFYKYQTKLYFKIRKEVGYEKR